MSTKTEAGLAAENIELRHAVRLLMAGWTVEKVGLYDEEGIEGWQWTDPDGIETAICTGLWDEPPTVPEILRK